MYSPLESPLSQPVEALVTPASADVRPAILITGATGGVGMALCRHLNRRFRVIALGRDANALAELAASLPGVEVHCLDLAGGEIASDIASLMEQCGDVGYLINNAGFNRPAPVDADIEAVLRRSLEVNAIAPAMLMAAVLPGMRRRGFGRIVNITSGAPLNCFAGHAAYSASKAALNALTVTAAREHQDVDIKINLMSPGPVRSKMAPEAPMAPEVCLPTLDNLLDLPADGASGRFFWLGHEIPLTPSLDGIDWLAGTAPAGFARLWPEADESSGLDSSGADVGSSDRACR